MSRQAEPPEPPEPPASAFDATTAIPRPDDPTVVVTPGLDATRVGEPEAEDPVQRGLRVFRRSAGRGIDAADAVYGRIQRVTQADGAGASGLANVLEMGAVIGRATSWSPSRWPTRCSSRCSRTRPARRWPSIC